MCLYLWYSVRCCVHELHQVHHTLPLVLRDVDALDRGEARIGVPKVLQLELPMSQPGPSQLHKHLAGQSKGQTVTDSTITPVMYMKINLFFHAPSPLLPCV